MKRNEKGQVLILVIVILSVTLILGTGLLAVTSNTHKNAISYVNNKQAQYVARSTLDMFTFYFENQPNDAKKLIKESGEVKTKNPIEFKDAQNQVWNSSVTIKDIGSEKYRITAEVTGTNGNSYINKKESVIIKRKPSNGGGAMHLGGSLTIDLSNVIIQNGAVICEENLIIQKMNDDEFGTNGLKLAALGNVNISSNANTISLDELYVGGNLDMISNSRLSTNNTLTGEVKIEDVKVKGQTTMDGNSWRMNLRNFYSGDGIFIKNNNPFNPDGRIGSIKTIDESKVDIASNCIVENAIQTISEVKMPRWVEEAITVPEESLKPQWVKDYEAESVAGSLSPESQKVQVVEGDMTITGEGLGPNENRFYVKEGKVANIKIYNYWEGDFKLDIYNPNGNVIFDSNGVGPQDKTATFNGGIIAQDVKLVNNGGLVLDLSNASGGGGSFNGGFETLYYEE